MKKFFFVILIRALTSIHFMKYSTTTRTNHLLSYALENGHIIFIFYFIKTRVRKMQRQSFQSRIDNVKGRTLSTCYIFNKIHDILGNGGLVKTCSSQLSFQSSYTYIYVINPFVDLFSTHIGSRIWIHNLKIVQLQTFDTIDYSPINTILPYL